MVASERTEELFLPAWCWKGEAASTASLFSIRKLIYCRHLCFVCSLANSRAGKFFVVLALVRCDQATQLRLEQSTGHSQRKTSKERTTAAAGRMDKGLRDIL